MLEIVDGRYYAYVWTIPADDGDWLGALWRDEGKPFVFDYRFRYTANDKLFDSEDEKSEYRITFGSDDTEESCCASVKELMSMLLDMGYSDAEPIELRFGTSNANEVWALLAKQPWCHVQTTTSKVGEA